MDTPQLNVTEPAVDFIRRHHRGRALAITFRDITC